MYIGIGYSARRKKTNFRDIGFAKLVIDDLGARWCLRYNDERATSD